MRDFRRGEDNIDQLGGSAISYAKLSKNLTDELGGTFNLVFNRMQFIDD